MKTKFHQFSYYCLMILAMGCYKDEFEVDYSNLRPTTTNASHEQICPSPSPNTACTNNWITSQIFDVSWQNTSAYIPPADIFGSAVTENAITILESKKLKQINPQTGETIWVKHLGEHFNNLLGNQSFLAVISYRKIVGIDTKTGNILWTIMTENDFEINEERSIILGKYLFIREVMRGEHCPINSEVKMQRIDGFTGAMQPLTFIPNRKEYYSLPAAIQTGSEKNNDFQSALIVNRYHDTKLKRVVFNLYELDINTLKMSILHHDFLPAEVLFKCFEIINGQIIVFSYNNEVMTFDLTSGEMLYKTQLPTLLQGFNGKNIYTVPYNGIDHIAYTTIMGNSNTDAPTFWVLNPTNHEVVLTKNLNRRGMSVFAAYGDQMLFGASNYHFYSMDRDFEILETMDISQSCPNDFPKHLNKIYSFENLNTIVGVFENQLIGFSIR